ncbi:NAD(P)H nitroreductase [Candidatus Methylospira mobilis]|uniref:Putative NAD(P)H nitroreductase n=1 Tax=Candidatus Methylospira mobilis TaxID=1808979 RepID=A0A5Q0BDC5_9GAMM|nr:NAD(P)H nitroreductase [Candidatus Methylospira mobilis]QFY41529.1 NAD(P)H nitroreductase [Candidatus Methylospira mobilis]WNV05234.1 NAD(P)H nitroreductase [Candidatus Methylospira mobilis]
MDAITLLLERRSCSALTAPAPEGEALEAVLKAAFRVPDFRQLRPYEFILAAGDGLDRLGALLEEAAKQSGKSTEIVNRAYRMPHRAPLVIVVAARHRPNALVSRFEQQLTAGCAVMSMQLAAVAQGFGGIWRSGWPMFDRGLHTALGLEEEDQIVGFLYLGTPLQPPEKPLSIVESKDFTRWL